jgi:hypothetical protein
LSLKKIDVLSNKARKRKLTNLKQNSTDKENFPEREERGQVRDIIGKSVGVSGKTVDKFNTSRGMLQSLLMIYTLEK